MHRPFLLLTAVFTSSSPGVTVVLTWPRLPLATGWRKCANTNEQNISQRKSRLLVTYLL